MAFSPWRNFTKLFVIRKFGPTRFNNREENKFEKHMQLLDGDDAPYWIDEQWETRQRPGNAARRLTD